eukprot:1161040-Pelagomonas_calceolata.AAC.6
MQPFQETDLVCMSIADGVTSCVGSAACSLICSLCFQGHGQVELASSKVLHSATQSHSSTSQSYYSCITSA